MNADLNPYESPTSSSEPIASATDDLEEIRRFRVALMWGGSGCGYLTLPWWLPPDAPYFAAPLLVIVSLAIAITVFVAAIGVAQLGKWQDVFGAICGIVFGAAFIGLPAIQMLFVMLGI